MRLHLGDAHKRKYSAPQLCRFVLGEIFGNMAQNLADQMGSLCEAGKSAKSNDISSAQSICISGSGGLAILRQQR